MFTLTLLYMSTKLKHIYEIKLKTRFDNFLLEIYLSYITIVRMKETAL